MGLNYCCYRVAEVAETKILILVAVFVVFLMLAIHIRDGRKISRMKQDADRKRVITGRAQEHQNDARREY
jgi:hypothetical protein